jgi:hypothetical protein
MHPDAPTEATLDALPTVPLLTTSKLRVTSRVPLYGLAAIGVLAAAAVVILLLSPGPGSSTPARAAAQDAGAASPALAEGGTAPGPVASAGDAGVTPPVAASADRDGATAARPVDPAAPAVRDPSRTGRAPSTAVIRGRAADRDVPAPPPPATVDGAALKRLYAVVGERINQAFTARDPRARDLRARYAALPYLPALRDPVEAARVERELHAIERQLATPP